MFAYNPTVNDQSGAILAQGQLGAAQADAAMMQQLGRDISKPIRTAGRAAAGFAMGGPAGAAMAVRGGDEEGGGGGGGDDSVIGSFVSAYANDKALRAKGEAYGDFMSKHGEQLGFNPEWLKDFAGRDPREQAMIGDNIIGMQNTGNRLMGLNSMQYQANLFSGGRGTGAGGMGSGAAAPQESVTF